MYMYVCICQCIELSAWKLLLCCVLWWAFGPLVVAPGTGFASWSKMGHQILRQCGASSRSALPCNFGDENHMFLQWETLILAVFEMLPASSVYRSRRYTSSRKMTWNPKFHNVAICTYRPPHPRNRPTTQHPTWNFPMSPVWGTSGWYTSTFRTNSKVHKLWFINQLTNPKFQDHFVPVWGSKSIWPYLCWWNRKFLKNFRSVRLRLWQGGYSITDMDAQYNQYSDIFRLHIYIYIYII